MLAIINGKVLTMAGATYDKGTVLIEDGKIKAVGDRIEVPADAQTVDAAGKIVMPGLIDPHCHVGIFEEIYRVEGSDGNENTDPVTPHLRAVDAVYPEDEAFRDALSGGVTTVITGPGSANVIGGEMLAMKTHGLVTDKMLIKAPVGLKIAFGENPKRVYGGQNKTPMTRMATAALLRETLTKAQNYLAKKHKGDKDPDKVFEKDLKMETMVRVLNREIPLRAHAHRADDILTAVRVAEEFNLRIIIEHCTEGYKIANELAEKNIPAIVGPIFTNRAKVELKDRSLENAGFLARAGVRIGIMTDHPVIPINYLSLSAALAVKAGLDEETALKAITSQAAEIVGIADRVGSLAPGKDADIIILNGPVFELKTRVEKVFVDGQMVFQTDG
jgi:imidazolonepropionase-like amidohydrolase